MPVGSYIGQIDIDGEIHNIGSTLYGTCSTAAATAAKAVVCPGFQVPFDGDPTEGVTIHVKFTYTNTATAPTLNVNSTGAKQIVPALPKWRAGSVVSFTYDGTSWFLDNSYWENTDTQVEQGLSTSTDNFPILLAGISTGTTPPSEPYIGTAKRVNSMYAIPSTGDLHATKFNGYTLGAACAKAIGSVASGNTGLVTGGDVYTAIQSAAAGSLQYQGTATSNSDIGTSYHAGWYWIVGSTGGTIAGQTVEAGDMILAHADYSGTLADDLDIVQSNVDRITNSDIDTIVAA